MTTDLSNKSVEELREFIREIIDYDPDTGIAKWRRSLSNAAPVWKVINTFSSASAADQEKSVEPQPEPSRAS